jgi:hypothetical protein
METPEQLATIASVAIFNYQFSIFNYGSSGVRVVK